MKVSSVSFSGPSIFCSSVNSYHGIESQMTTRLYEICLKCHLCFHLKQPLPPVAIFHSHPFKRLNWQYKSDNVAQSLFKPFKLSAIPGGGRHIQFLDHLTGYLNSF